MTAFQKGMKANYFALKAPDGKIFSLHTYLQKCQVALFAFFKVSCPTCQLTFPYLERLHRSYPSLPIWGISQDDADATSAFARMYGCSFPLLLDEGLELTASYQLTNVPTILVVNENGEILELIIGFDKAALENANKLLSSHGKLSEIPLFTEADEVPAFKPG